MIPDVVRRVWGEVTEDEVFTRAAALSYYFVFALFPALLFLTALLGLLPWRLMDVVMDFIAQAAPTDIVQRTFAEIARGASGGLLSVGIAGALYTATSGMVAIIDSLNVAYDVVDERAWWHRRLVAMALTLGASLFTLTGLILLIFGEALGRGAATMLGLGAFFEVSWALLRWALAVAFLVFGVNLVYHFAPARRPPWRWLSVGSAFAVLGWIAMSLALRVYATTYATYNATYGSIAGVILLLLWLYLSGAVLLIGAEIDSEVGRRAAGADGRSGAETGRRPGGPRDARRGDVDVAERTAAARR
jgi:membrane protein